MNQLPETGFLRLPQIIGDAKAIPPIPPLIPVKKSSWWAGVKSGRYPKSVKLGPRTTAWRVEDINALIKELGAEIKNPALTEAIKPLKRLEIDARKQFDDEKQTDGLEAYSWKA